LKSRTVMQGASLLFSASSVLLVATWIVERLYWRWFQGIKIGESTSDWPFISTSSFWLSFPWLVVTVIFASFAWEPTSVRWLRRALIVAACVEAVLIWWMASAGLRSDPITP